jgi:hypothetical protein
MPQLPQKVPRRQAARAFKKLHPRKPSQIAPKRAKEPGPDPGLQFKSQ